MNLSDNVSVINGVGEKRLALLKKLGIETVWDLLTYYPRDYEDRREIKKTDSLVPGEMNSLCAVIRESCENLRINGKIITRLKITDEAGTLEIVWFNMPYVKTSIKPGGLYFFTGRVMEKPGRGRVLQMQSPEYELIDEADDGCAPQKIKAASIIPIYRLTSGISQKVFRSLVKAVADGCAEQLDEFLPDDVKNAYKLRPRPFAVKNIHFPGSDEEFLSARRRLVFDELFLMQCALLKIKGIIKTESDCVINDFDRYGLKFPFAFTRAQEAALDDIENDMRSGFVMNRLVQGDVGSGKTAVAAAAAYAVIRGGWQCAMMAPTEVLARQHYDGFCELLEPAGVSVLLLVGSMTQKEKKAARERIADGSAQMIVGTHALIQEGVEFASPGLVITDEQHRFGVYQRLALSSKGSAPHVLVMTATPIPRTLALVLYGDMDISVIGERPPGRRHIDTFYVTSAYRERAFGFIKKQLDEGRQAYIICPQIEEGETNTGLLSLSAYAGLMARYFGEYRVLYLHGKLPTAEKAAVMERFCSGSADVIVSTTVIEVGINVPNATIILIENADRFGLSQLHQLRGRVGRSDLQSYCILVSDAKSDVARKRLGVMKKTNDGFEISETDLTLRGPGDFFGTRQHGLPEMKISNLYKDLAIMELAKEAAVEFFSDRTGIYENERRFVEAEVGRIMQNGAGTL